MHSLSPLFFCSANAMAAPAEDSDDSRVVLHLDLDCFCASARLLTRAASFLLFLPRVTASQPGKEAGGRATKTTAQDSFQISGLLTL